MLLIDGDLRRPSIERSLKISNEKGLSNILVGQVSNDVKVRGILNENLDLICAGAIPPNPAKLIQSKEMSDFLERESNNYDYIIVDLPPVLSVVDSIGLSKVLDGVIVVAKHSYTRRRDLLETINSLKFAKANILGIIYNCYSVSQSGHHYKNYKYYESNKEGNRNEKN